MPDNHHGCVRERAFRQFPLTARYQTLTTVDSGAILSSAVLAPFEIPTALLFD